MLLKNTVDSGDPGVSNPGVITLRKCASYHRPKLQERFASDCQKQFVWNSGDWIMLTPRARIVERFTRIAADELLYSFEVDDPDAYTQAWRGEHPMRASPGPLFEYACHEGNYALTNILAGGRAKDREAAGAKAAGP